MKHNGFIDHYKKCQLGSIYYKQANNVLVKVKKAAT